MQNQPPPGTHCYTTDRCTLNGAPVSRSGTLTLALPGTGRQSMPG